MNKNLSCNTYGKHYITLKSEIQNFWQFTFVFGRLEIKRRSCEIPFPKSVVYNDAVLNKLEESYKSFFPSKMAESYLQVVDGHSHWQVLKVSRLLNNSKLCWKNCLSKKNFKENMKIIGWPYQITLKSLTGHTSLWLTDFPYYDQRKKQETNVIP